MPKPNSTDLEDKIEAKIIALLKAKEAPDSNALKALELAVKWAAVKHKITEGEYGSDLLGGHNGNGGEP